MAQVVNEYLSWHFSRLEVTGWCTTKRKGDYLSALRLLYAVCRLVVARITRRSHTFVVHMSQGGSFVREGCFVVAARTLGFPVAIQIHGSEFVPFAEARRRLVRTVVCRADSVFVLTSPTRDVLRQLLAGRAVRPRIVQIPNAVAMPPLPSQKSPRVLMCGELSLRKGTDLLLSAWEVVGEKHPDWVLQLAGPDRGDFADRARSQKAVSYLGPLPREQVLDLAEQASVAVLPSRHEAMPMFLIEAMARGCAIVATPVGEVQQLLGSAGLMAEVGDADSLARSLDQLMSSSSRRSAMGQAARARAEDRYSEAAVKAILENEWLNIGRDDGQ